MALCEQLQDAVTTAHDVSERFNDETLTEHGIFQLAKRVEMKDMLGSLADGQIAMYKKVNIPRDRFVCPFSCAVGGNF